MRFLSLAKVRADIVSGGLTEQATFQYLLGWLILFFLVNFPLAGGQSPGPRSYFVWLLSCVINIWGVRQSSIANGGAGGRDFVSRFLALGWVLALRLWIALLLAVVALFVLAVCAGVVMGLARFLQPVLGPLPPSSLLLGLVSEVLPYLLMDAWIGLYYRQLCVNLRRVNAGG